MLIMKRVVIVASTILLLILFFDIGSAQNFGTKQLTLEALYKDNVFRQKDITSVRWMKDQKRYSTLETNKDSSGKDIVAYDAENGNREVLISAKNLIPEGQDKPLTIGDYNWSADNAKLLIFTNTRKVWRLHTRGDYWVLDLSTNRLSQVGRAMEPARLMFAKFSPNGEMVGFVYKNNIYVENLN